MMNLDPDCAICSQPALAQCECEAKGLDIAVRQAEQKMMTTFFSQIREWVRGHAQDYILSYYEVLTTRRKDAHAVHMAQITERAAYYYRTRPHPSEIAAANAELKRGIDEDWRASVQRYPEVLEYYYSLVNMSLPDDDETAVKDPPLSALTGARMKGQQRLRVEEERRRAPPPGSTSSRRPGHAPWAGPPPPGFVYAGQGF